MLFGFLSLSILPECLLSFGILVTLLTGSFVKRKLLVWAQALFVVSVCIFVLLSLGFSDIELINKLHWTFDPLAKILKISTAISVLFVLLYSKYWVENDSYLSYEAIVLILTTLLGSWVVISAQHMLTLFVGIELMSLPLYALVAIRSRAEDDASTLGIEASLKYFITGSMASACLLYGFSLLFGATGHMDYSSLLTALSHIPSSQYHGVVIGIVFVVIATGFKFGLVPFHMWVPDVYQGAPLSVTLLIATLPKLALVGMVIRLFGDVLINNLAVWQPLFIVLGVASMILGNGVALFQTNLPRLLGYSSIAHMGVLVLSFIVAAKQGWHAAVFYMITYVLTTSLLFGGLLQLKLTNNNIKDLAGLGKANGKLALILLLALFSLASVPPVVGFIAKFMVLKVLLSQHLFLVITIVLMSCIGCFYYIRVVKIMYFDEFSANVVFNKKTSCNIALLLNSLLVLLIGVMPLFLMKLIILN